MKNSLVYRATPLRRLMFSTQSFIGKAQNIRNLPAEDWHLIQGRFVRLEDASCLQRNLLVAGRMGLWVGCGCYLHWRLLVPPKGTFLSHVAGFLWMAKKGKPWSNSPRSKNLIKRKCPRNRFVLRMESQQKDLATSGTCSVPSKWYPGH